ncbi:MAG: hypothetical protein HYT87_14145 [Nitrospirae bacterium]|nr:hypothetical protein [Nitrospirota bacterium]
MANEIGYWASVILPFFNLPLIWHLVRRKSSQDISLTWAGGVWACIVLMTPRAISSPDAAFRVFGWLNIVLFSVVAGLVFWLRVRNPAKPPSS